MIKLEPYNSISKTESLIAEAAVQYGPLSGYLGGESKGGYYVEKLEADWCETFGCKHAIAVNSATSGLLAACVAADIRQGDRVITTPYTMSATAATPQFLGAEVVFQDIETSHYCLNPANSVLTDAKPRAIIATNLFGHPADLVALRTMNKAILIEDNAQAPFAMQYGKYTGTIGHIGIWSMNVHKHIQCGEGGICGTNNDGTEPKCNAETALNKVTQHQRKTDHQDATWSH